MDSDSKSNEPADTSPKKPGQAAAIAAAIAGFDTRDLLRRWRSVITQPRIATFDDQQSGASWLSVILQLAILAVLDAILAALVLGGNILVDVAANIVSAYLGFFVFTLLYFAFARVFGGKGAFLPYAFVLTLIYVPLQILGILLGIIPAIGIFLLLALSVYQLVLSVYATASVHHLTIGRASVAVLVPFVLLLFLSSFLAGATGTTIFGL